LLAPDFSCGPRGLGTDRIALGDAVFALSTDAPRDGAINGRTPMAMFAPVSIWIGSAMRKAPRWGGRRRLIPAWPESRCPTRAPWRIRCRSTAVELPVDELTVRAAVLLAGNLDLCYVRPMSDEVAFYSQIGAALRPEHVVLDFGAGSGQLVSDPLVDRGLVDFRGRCAHVEGCDVEGSVLLNPTLDGAAVVRSGEPLPYASDRFDLIVCRSVFEHLDHPASAADELLRVLKPGGSIFVITPNRWGYVALAARLIPSRLHGRLLKRLQPNRREDVFPARYGLNTPRTLRKMFRGAEVACSFVFGPPAYGTGFLRTLMLALHRLLPARMAPQLHAVIRKPDMRSVCTLSPRTTALAPVPTPASAGA
jgi:SAM-dependent methyltransferase